MLKTKIVSEIKNILGNDQFVLLEPKDNQWGDYSLFMQHGTDNIKHLIKEISINNLCSKVEQKGSYVNFFINPYLLIEEMNLINQQKEKYANNEFLKGNNIMVEFAHPNTHKAFHLGHLRNIISGESIIRLLESQSVKVIRVNYQGDVGMHIAKCLYGILRAQISNVKNQNLENISQLPIQNKVEYLGKMYANGSKAFEENDEAKKEIAEINKKIYAKDPEIYPLYQQTRQWSLDYFDAIYQRLGTHFDRLYFESEVYQTGKKLVLEGLEKGIFEKSQGAIIFRGEKFGLHSRVFITKEGNPTYEAKDMGLGQLQFKEYNPDLIIHVLGPEQQGYTKVMFEALYQLFPHLKDKQSHLVYGWVQLKQGKMSSRLGNVITGEWLLDKIKNTIIEKYNSQPKTAEILAIASIKYSFLKSELIKNISFDFEQSISLTGNSGPYLLYTYARCKSILSQSTFDFPITIDKLSITDSELSLLRVFIKFPEVVSNAAKNYAPHLICNYLYNLCQRFSYFYEKNPVLKAENDVKNFRLALTSATAHLIKNSLYLLGIKTVNRL